MEIGIRIGIEIGIQLGIGLASAGAQNIREGGKGAPPVMWL